MRRLFLSLSVLAAVSLTAQADTYRLNPDGTVSTISSEPAPAPREKTQTVETPVLPPAIVVRQAPPRTTTKLTPLDEVNRQRAQRGLKPYIEDPDLTVAAQGAANYRAQRLIFGHVDDFAFLPRGSSADAAGCAAYPESYGFMACAVYDNYNYAGAAVAFGRDGKRYCHLFVRNSPPRRTPVRDFLERRVEQRTSAQSCDCAETGVCSCKANCSCPDCSVVPEGYAAVYARVMKGERVTFDLYEKVGTWEAGTWDCWLDKETGVMHCQLRQTPVVPQPQRSAPVGRVYPSYPFSLGGSVCLPGRA